MYKPAADAVGGLFILPVASVNINFCKYVDAEYTVNAELLTDELININEALTDCDNEFTLALVYEKEVDTDDDILLLSDELIYKDELCNEAEYKDAV